MIKHISPFQNLTSANNIPNPKTSLNYFLNSDQLVVSKWPISFFQKFQISKKLRRKVLSPNVTLLQKLTTLLLVSSSNSAVFNSNNIHSYVKPNIFFSGFDFVMIYHWWEFEMKHQSHLALCNLIVWTVNRFLSGRYYRITHFVHCQRWKFIFWYFQRCSQCWICQEDFTCFIITITL